jgi:hypothetical protein
MCIYLLTERGLAPNITPLVEMPQWCLPEPLIRVAVFTPDEDALQFWVCGNGLVSAGLGGGGDSLPAFARIDDRLAAFGGFARGSTTSPLT